MRRAYSIRRLRVPSTIRLSSPMRQASSAAPSGRTSGISSCRRHTNEPRQSLGASVAGTRPSLTSGRPNLADSDQRGRARHGQLAAAAQCVAVHHRDRGQREIPNARAQLLPEPACPHTRRNGAPRPSSSPMSAPAQKAFSASALEQERPRVRRLHLGRGQPRWRTSS